MSTSYYLINKKEKEEQKKCLEFTEQKIKDYTKDFEDFFENTRFDVDDIVSAIKQIQYKVEYETTPTEIKVCTTMFQKAVFHLERDYYDNFHDRTTLESVKKYLKQRVSEGYSFEDEYGEEQDIDKFIKYIDGLEELKNISRK